MPMTKAELIDAFRDAASAEFEGLPPHESDCDYEFSESFERSMDRLVRAEDRAVWRFFNTNPKRLIIVVAAAVIVMFTIACTFPGVRESMSGLLVRVFSDHSEISLIKSRKSSIEKEYELLPIPEGYEITTRYKETGRILIEYKNEDNEIIRFQQLADPEFRFFADNVHGEYDEYDFDGKTVFLYSSEYYYNAIWEEDGYLFVLYCSINTELKTIESWIASTKPAE